MTWPRFNPETHAQTCVMRHRVRAASLALFSLFMSVVCWHEIGRPFPGPPDGLMVTAGIPAFAALAIYLFVTIACIWERLWIGPVAGGLVISSVEMVGAQLVSPFIAAARIVSLALWVWTTAIGIGFVWSAFVPDHAKDHTGSPPAGLSNSLWKGLFAWRTLGIASAYLVVALALDWRDLHRRQILHPLSILVVDGAFEALLCAWAAILTEVAIRLLRQRRNAEQDKRGRAEP